MEKRVGIVCSYCGSDEVLLDSWAQWDVEKQRWVLADTATATFCRNCDGETRLIEVELSPAT